MRKRNFILLLLIICSNHLFADLLEDILNRGYIRVGTTGDYKPFSHKNKKIFTGYDIDVAKHIASELGVEIQFVETTWSNLLGDLQTGKYDIAMGGITRKISRQLEAEQTKGYMTFGKCFMVRAGEEKKYQSIEAVNKKEVVVGVNIGGTNEAFAKEHLKGATIKKYKNNLDVPEALLNGEIDVMVTESPEALFYKSQGRGHSEVRAKDPFTKGQFTYLVPSGEQRLLNTINFLMDDMQIKEIDKKLEQQNGLR